MPAGLRPVGPGCFVRPWAAARPRAVRAACCRCVASLVFRAPSGPAAREIATREPAARSGRSRSPPVPSGPAGALHTSGAWSLMCGSRVGSKPGQAPPPPTAAAAGPSVPPAPSTPVAPSVLCGVGQAPPPPTAAVARPSCALHTGGTCVAWTSPARPCCWSPSPRAVERSLLSPQSISHAIPSQLFQTMNLDCWNCNVFRRC